MKCPKCKKELDQGVKFCSFCGAKVEKHGGSTIFRLLLPLIVAVAGCMVGIFVAAHLGQEKIPPEITEATVSGTETSATVHGNGNGEVSDKPGNNFPLIIPGTYADRNSMLNTLTITEVTKSSITLSMSWPAVWRLNGGRAILNGNVAAFDYDCPAANSTSIQLKGTIEFDGNAAVLKLTESNTAMKPGEYNYDLVGKELSDEQLHEISKMLRVPENLETQIIQGEPGYWEGGGFYRTSVEIYHNGELIAGASVNSLSGDIAGAIYLYSGGSETVAGSNDQDDASSVRTGDILRFGHYEQDGLRSNGTEEIEWLVLDVQDGKALLLSHYALDSQPYNMTYGSVTWEDCTLRNWLNSTFLETAFTEEERASIMLTEADNGSAQNNHDWSVKGCKNTDDRVFLLSYADTDRYFDAPSACICTPTNYAISMGADVRTLDDGITEAGWWWLRSPGETSTQASFVNFDGTRYTNRVGNGYLSVRPALWIDLEKWNFQLAK